MTRDLNGIRIRDVVAFKIGAWACTIYLVVTLLWDDLAAAVQTRGRA